MYKIFPKSPCNINSELPGIPREFSITTHKLVSSHKLIDSIIPYSSETYIKNIKIQHILCQFYMNLTEELL